MITEETRIEVKKQGKTRYGKITGVELVTIKGGIKKACFLVKWKGEVKSWIPIDNNNYKIIELEKVKHEEIKIT